jgi:hypothetical protein
VLATTKQASRCFIADFPGERGFEEGLVDDLCRFVVADGRGIVPERLLGPAAERAERRGEQVATFAEGESRVGVADGVCGSLFAESDECQPRVCVLKHRPPVAVGNVRRRGSRDELLEERARASELPIAQRSIDLRVGGSRIVDPARGSAATAEDRSSDDEQRDAHHGRRP